MGLKNAITHRAITLAALTSAFFFFLTSARVASAADPLPSIPVDKKLHFLASYALTLSCHQVYTERSWVCPDSVFALGAVKELVDERGDRNDMAANTLGIVAAWSWRF